jgi:hypothetical protein
MFPISSVQYSPFVLCNIIHLFSALYSICHLQKFLSVVCIIPHFSFALF